MASPVFEAASELILNPGSQSVQLHSDLAKLTLNDTEDVKVLSNHYSSEPAMVTLPRLSELRASLENELFSVEERTELAAVCSGSLALYTEEGVYSRCLVHGREGKTVEIYLLDSGQTRLCSRDGFDLKEKVTTARKARWSETIQIFFREKQCYSSAIYNLFLYTFNFSYFKFKLK